MPTYVMLMKYSPEGIRTIKQAPDRLEAARKTAQSVGGEVKAAYMTFGRYDVVVVVEAPDDETMAKLAIGTGMVGNLSTETMRAFTVDELPSLLEGLP